MKYIEWLDDLNLVNEKEKLEVLMIVFVSVILKKTDNGDGYDFKEMSKYEFENLLYSKIMKMEFDNEMKELVIKIFKIINNYD
jgi:hypothetical protein